MVVCLAAPTRYIFWFGHAPWYLPWSALIRSPDKDIRCTSLQFRAFTLPDMAFPIFLEDTDAQWVLDGKGQI